MSPLTFRSHKTRMDKCIYFFFAIFQPVKNGQISIKWRVCTRLAAVGECVVVVVAWTAILWRTSVVIVGSIATWTPHITTSTTGCTTRTLSRSIIARSRPIIVTYDPVVTTVRWTILWLLYFHIQQCTVRVLPWIVNRLNGTIKTVHHTTMLTI